MEPTSIQKIFVSAASLLLPGIGQAHPGHIPADGGIAHWLGSPFHFLGAFAASALIVAALCACAHARRERG